MKFLKHVFAYAFYLLKLVPYLTAFAFSSNAVIASNCFTVNVILVLIAAISLVEASKINPPSIL